MSFKVGDRVVWSGKFILPSYVDADEVYTIGSFNGESIILKEIPLKVMQRFDRKDETTTGWHSEAWRKVDDIRLQKELAIEAIKHVEKEKNKERQLEEV